METSSDSTQVAEKILNHLYDSKFIHRYGTSINIQTHEHQKSIEDRYNLLKDEFAKINKDGNDYIDIDELKTFLEAYQDQAHIALPKDYYITLFKLIDINKDNKITIQEFVGAYVLLEEKLKLKKIKLEKLRDELQLSMNKTIKEKERYNNEQLNPFGVSLDAHIKISLLEARDLRPMDYNGKSDPYCILSIDGKHRQVSSYKPNTLDPVWNEDFFLPVTSKEETVKIEVMDKDSFGSDDLEGIVHISVKELLHQENIDDWLGLKRPTGEEEMGFLRLRIQLIWSKRQYYTDMLSKSEKQMSRIDKDLTELEKYIELIEKPYGIILYGEIMNLVESKLLEKGEESIHYSESNRNYLALSKINNNESFAMKLDNVFKGVLKTSIEWSLLTQILIYSNVLLCLIVALLARSDFIGLFIGIFVFVLFIIQNRLEILDYLRYYLQVNLVNVIYDLTWLIFHYQGYWNGSDYDYAELGLKKWTFFFSFINFIVKFILLISLWISYDRALKRQKRSSVKQ